MQSLFSKITRAVIRSRRLYHHHHHHHHRGHVYSIQLREVGIVREHVPLLTWNKFICVKGANVPEGEPLPESVPVPVPVPVPEHVPVCVDETVRISKPDPDPEDKSGEDFWDVAYHAVLQTVALVLAILAALCTISGYLRKLAGGEKKKLEETSKKSNLLILVMILQLQIMEQMLEKMVADEKAKKESWFFKLIRYK